MSFSIIRSGSRIFKWRGGGGRRLCARNAYHERKTRSPYYATGVHSPLKGLGSSMVLDVLAPEASIGGGGGGQ